MFEAECIEILHGNVQGLLSHKAELSARLRTMTSKPAVLCLSETFLDKSIGSVELEGYVLAARRDRTDGRTRGGIIVFARTDIANRITQIEESAGCRKGMAADTQHGGAISSLCVV